MWGLTSNANKKAAHNVSGFEDQASANLLKQLTLIVTDREETLSVIANQYWTATEKNVRQRLALDPLDEDAHRTLMRVLAFAGLRNAALFHYDFQDIGRVSDCQAGGIFTRSGRAVYRQASPG